MADCVAFLKAVQANDARTVKHILEQGQTTLDILNSALCWAARLGNLPLVILLVESGADPNSEVWGGITPIMWTTMFSSSSSIINYLVQCGADVNRCSKMRRQGALHAAVIKGDLDIAEVLIGAGAFLDMQDYLCKTPLLHAVQRNLSSCVKTLIKHNCNVDISGFVNGASLSPLLVTLLQNNLEITEMLILAGAKFERTAIYQTITLTQFYRTVESQLQMELRPVYLTQQCRVCIRNLLKPQFLQKLQEMNLPKLLRDFLMLDELNRIC